MYKWLKAGQTKRKIPNKLAQQYCQLQLHEKFKSFFLMVWKIYNYLHVTSRIKYLRNFPLQVVCSVEQRYIIQLKSEFQEPKQVKCRFNFETPSKTLQRIQIVKKFGYITIICTNNFWRYVSYLFLSISLFSMNFLQKNFRQNQGKNSTRVSCVRTHANA